MKVKQATKVVVYVIEEVKKIDPFCGGPTQVMALSKDGVLQLKPREVKEITDLVMGQDEDLANFWRSLILEAQATPSNRTKAKG